MAENNQLRTWSSLPSPANDDQISSSPERLVGSGQTTGKIITRDNVLDQFASYSYVASVYMLTAEQQKAFMDVQNQKFISSYNLLFQSGGAPQNSGGIQGSKAGEASALNPNTAVQAGRNPFFNDDFYIDAITIDTAIIGKATMAAHSATKIKFTVMEPNGITLMQRLYQAAQDLNPKTANGAVNYAALCYVMVIRFYGYDINGNIVQVSAKESDVPRTDPKSVVEKFIPFYVRNINFSVTNKQIVSYEWDCAAIGMIGASTRRGTIPVDMGVSGATVQDMLTGSTTFLPEVIANTNATEGRPTTTTQATRAPAPPTATSAPSRSVLVTGLIQEMNRKQEELRKDGVYEIADQYKIVFADSGKKIASSTVNKPGSYIDRSSTSNPQPNNTQALSPEKQVVSTNTRSFGVTAGMQLVQAIDLIIRNSTYILGQSNTIFQGPDGVSTDNPASRTSGQSGFQWFNILITARQLGYDNKRNDHAYELIYTIVPYDVPSMVSPYFAPSPFRGVHKQYQYWFTGKNTSILDYSASFNKLYYVTLTTSSEGKKAFDQYRERYTSSALEIPFYHYDSASTESRQGDIGRSNEPAANAAEYMYNPSDNARCKLQIIGDPAWIQQGSVKGGVDPSSISVFSNGFTSDGSINYDTSDVFFEIVWQKPEDYDLESGLADPYKSQQNRNPIQSAIYRARTVQHEFRQGKFTQTLEGTLFEFRKPEGNFPSNNPDNMRMTPIPSETFTSEVNRRFTSGPNTSLEITPNGKLRIPKPISGLFPGPSTSEPVNNETPQPIPMTTNPPAEEQTPEQGSIFINDTVALNSSGQIGAHEA